MILKASDDSPVEQICYILTERKKCSFLIDFKKNQLNLELIKIKFLSLISSLGRYHVIIFLLPGQFRDFKRHTVYVAEKASGLQSEPVSAGSLFWQLFRK